MRDFRVRVFGLARAGVRPVAKAWFSGVPRGSSMETAPRFAPTPPTLALQSRGLLISGRLLLCMYGFRVPIRIEKAAVPQWYLFPFICGFMSHLVLVFSILF